MNQGIKMLEGTSKNTDVSIIIIWEKLPIDLMYKSATPMKLNRITPAGAIIFVLKKLLKNNTDYQ